MNREIRFRVWDKKEKHWKASMPKMIVSDGGVWGLCGSKYERENLLIQQYTGMKDTNGVEIYEGDFLCEKYTDEMAANGSGASVGIVYFAAGTFMIDGDGPMYDHLESTSPDILQDYLVIGNIFTNPELLTK